MCVGGSASTHFAIFISLISTEDLSSGCRGDEDPIVRLTGFFRRWNSTVPKTGSEASEAINL